MIDGQGGDALFGQLSGRTGGRRKESPRDHVQAIDAATPGADPQRPLRIDGQRGHQWIAQALRILGLGGEVFEATAWRIEPVEAPFGGDPQGTLVVLRQGEDLIADQGSGVSGVVTPAREKASLAVESGQPASHRADPEIALVVLL